MRRIALAALGALALAAPAAASNRHPTLGEMENEVMCPICHTTLAESDSPAAQRIKAYIVRRIAAGETKGQIERELVADFGPSILAEPPKKGFDLLAWVLPIAGLLGGALVLGYAAWRWSRDREPEPALAGGPVLDPEADRRVDDALARFE